MTFIIAINIPNDGISYRYLYPYKFIAIFFGYNYIKKLALKFVYLVASGGLEPPRE